MVVKLVEKMGLLDEKKKKKIRKMVVLLLEWRRRWRRKWWRKWWKKLVVEEMENGEGGRPKARGCFSFWVLDVGWKKKEERKNERERRKWVFL